MRTSGNSGRKNLIHELKLSPSPTRKIKIVRTVQGCILQGYYTGLLRCKKTENEREEFRKIYKKQDINLTQETRPKSGANVYLVWNDSFKKELISR